MLRKCAKRNAHTRTPIALPANLLPAAGRSVKGSFTSALGSAHPSNGGSLEGGGEGVVRPQDRSTVLPAPPVHVSWEGLNYGYRG